jgi:glycerol kinase
VRARTGLTLDPMFSASKARWLLDHVDDADGRADRGDLCIGTMDTWLVWNLTGGASFVTDVTNASRTLLLDLDRLIWDPELLLLFGVPDSALPMIRGSSAIVGRTRPLGRLPADLPVASLIGDSHAALVGHGVPGPGSVKATFGTGTSVMAPLLHPVRHERLSSTVAWSVERPGTGDMGGAQAIEAVPALEGNITATGAALQWTATILGLEGGEQELDALAQTVLDSGGAYLVPAFAGLGAPHWDQAARGVVCGLTRGTTAAHLARASFDAIGYQVRDVLEVLAPSVGSPLGAILADGGAMRSALLCRVVADAVRLPVLIDRSESLAALGAAYLAGLAIGTWRSLDEIRALPRRPDRFDPDVTSSAWDVGYAGWGDALRRAASTEVASPSE